MKKLLLLSAALIVSAPAYAVVKDAAPVSTRAGISDVSLNANTVKGAEGFVSSVARRGIGFLSDESATEQRRIGSFKKLLKDSFDMKTIARFSLGRYWRSATTAEKKEYLKLFEAMIVSVYSNRFGEYNGERLEVTGSRPEGKRDIVVNSVIVPKNGPNIDVGWRVRFKDGQYKVVDIIVEGVSMAVTQRSDFSSVIQRGGGKMEVLLAHLRQQ